MYTINVIDATRILNSRKDFILLNISNDNKITDYRLTNDLTKFRGHYETFRLVEVIKKEITNGIKIF
jgi:hypothetical protein